MPKVTYNNKNATFFPSLKHDIDQYFKENNIKKTGNWTLYFKTIILFTSATAIYLSLLFVDMTAGWGLFLSSLLGFILALIGFNVMHDACHGSYSQRNRINEILGYSLNALGGNSFMWKQKHNVIHHTYTNVDGLDDDIAKSPFIRQCQTQRWVPAHKVQHIYLSFLYAVSTLFWILWQDFNKYYTKKVYTTKMNKMTRKDHIIFWVSKILYVFFYIALPIYLHGWQNWLAAYMILNATMGLTMSVIFQLAHVLEETEFEYVGLDDTKVIENEWAIHQIKTTANFSPNNPIITYLAGGLNYQVEHHLFPRISHVHYPAISKIVKSKCEEFGIPYLVNDSIFKAVHDHYSFIKKLGMQP